jgi:hypothetical protein
MERIGWNAMVLTYSERIADIPNGLEILRMDWRYSEWIGDTLSGMKILRMKSEWEVRVGK